MLKKKPEKTADEQTLRLRAAASRKRPWTWQGLLIVLAVILVPLGLLVWSVWPRAAPPALMVTAYDAVAFSKQEVVLRALLEPVEPQTGAVDLSGYELSFETGDLAKITVLGKAKTDAGGQATLALRPPDAAPLALFTVRYAGDKTRRPSASQGKIYTLDANGAVLVADLAALSPAAVQTWRTKNVLEVRATAGAGAALKAAHDKKYQLVYLATAADGGRLYGKMRGWVENQWAAAEPFPPGPVLATTSELSAADIVKDLRGRFRRPPLVVAGSSVTAKALRETGASIFDSLTELKHLP